MRITITITTEKDVAPILAKVSGATHQAVNKTTAKPAHCAPQHGNRARQRLPRPGSMLHLAFIELGKAGPRGLTQVEFPHGWKLHDCIRQLRHRYGCEILVRRIDSPKHKRIARYFLVGVCHGGL